jgi:hypothetical protein
VASWDWGRVNWEGFSEALQDIRGNIEEAEGHINTLASDDAVSVELHEALSNITSALVGLTFVVNMHHQHVAELEGRGDHA